MEDNGLEYTPETRGKTHVSGIAARNAARLVPEAIELLSIINTLVDEGHTELLGDLLRIARSIAGRSQATCDATGVGDDKGDGPSSETL